MQVLYTIILCILLLITTVSGLTKSVQQYDHVIYVDPTDPSSRNDSSCYTGLVPCTDINVALAFPNRQHSTMFALSSKAVHYLASNRSTTVFTGSSNIAIYGQSESSFKPAIIECKKEAGLAFISSFDISISNVEFRYCGSLRNSTNRDFTTTSFQLKLIRVSLYFHNCQNVLIESTSVINSTEALGVIMYSTTGINRITNSTFSANRVSKDNTQESGGGGFTVEFNYCKPGDSNCSEHDYQTDNISNAVYIFENCSFIGNRAIDRSGKNNTNRPILPQNRTHSSFGRGGGLALFFKGEAYNNTITINDCVFQANGGNWGGGLYTVYADSSIQNQVYISDSVFLDNHCHSDLGASGGGGFIASTVHYIVLKDNSFMRNLISFHMCTFTENGALTGGALSLVYNYQRQSHFAQAFQANLSYSSFKSNKARLGSAVSVDHLYFYHVGDIGSINIVSCSFIGNAIVYLDRSKPYSVGIGALYLSEVRATFYGRSSFEGNSGSAVAVIGTQAVLYDNSSLVFVGNSGSRGGALSFLGVSSLVIGENTELFFTNNVASLYGGAIYNSYIGREDFQSSVKCFFQYIDPFMGPNKWQTFFKFVNNSAGKLGNSLYSTTVLPCSWTDDLHTDINIVRNIFCWNESIWVYQNSTCEKEIYTNPKKFDTSMHTNAIYPGHPFHLNITAWDDLNHNVTKETIYTAVTGNASTAQVDPEYAYIADGYLSVSGEENQNVKLGLDVAGYRDSHLELSLVMHKCPPGFKPADNVTTSEITCECIGIDSLYTYRGNLFCDKPDLTSEIRNGYWIGHIPSIDNAALLMGAASLPYRVSRGDFSPLTRSYAELDAIQCQSDYRTGPLCGECLSNYSTAVNSYNYACVLCDNTVNKVGLAFLYIVLTYIPYLLMFLAIIYFQLSLMSGPEVGFILHAQLVGAGLLELTKNSGSYIDDRAILYGLQKSYRVVYGVFNLDSLAFILDPFCVREGFSALDVIMLDYAVALFPLVVIIVALIAQRIRDRCKMSKNQESSTVPNETPPKTRSLVNPFIAFLYLSYIKFTLASINILTTTGIIREDGSESSTRLVYFAGQYFFDEATYLVPYGLIAIFVLIFISFLVPILLLGQLSPIALLNRISENDKKCGFYKYWSSSKVKEFLKPIYSCYKPKYKWFAGIYFFLRLILLLIYAFSFNQVSKKLLQQVVCVVMIALIAFFQPYSEEKKLINLLDILILINITIINAISIYTFTSSFQNVESNFPVAMYSIGWILIWIPLGYMILYMIFRAIKKRCSKSIKQEKLCHYIEKLCLFFDPFYTSNKKPEHEEPDTHTALLNRAEEKNTYRRIQGPTTTTVEIEESVH